MDRGGVLEDLEIVSDGIGSGAEYVQGVFRSFNPGHFVLEAVQIGGGWIAIRAGCDKLGLSLAPGAGCIPDPWTSFSGVSGILSYC